MLSALIRRPADTGLPTVCAHLTVTADLAALEGTSNAPGEVNGLPITAGHLRDLLARVSALGLTTPDGGTLRFAVTGPDGQLLATLTPAELIRLARRGCPTHPDPAADADTDQPCACGVAGPPPPTDAYAPTDRQRAFVTTRDRRCRFPNCGQRIGWADLDHVTAHRPPCRVPPRAREWWGARGSFDFAPGWRFTMTPDGVITVTTPSGVTRTTRPPGQRPRPPGPPAHPPEPAPRHRHRSRTRRPSRSPA